MFVSHPFATTLNTVDQASPSAGSEVTWPPYYMLRTQQYLRNFELAVTQQEDTYRRSVDPNVDSAKRTRGWFSRRTPCEAESVNATCCKFSCPDGQREGNTRLSFFLGEKKTGGSQCLEMNLRPSKVQTPDGIDSKS